MNYETLLRRSAKPETTKGAVVATKPFPLPGERPPRPDDLPSDLESPSSLPLVPVAPPDRGRD